MFSPRKGLISPGRDGSLASSAREEASQQQVSLVVSVSFSHLLPALEARFRRRANGSSGPAGACIAPGTRDGGH